MDLKWRSGVGREEYRSPEGEADGRSRRVVHAQGAQGSGALGSQGQGLQGRQGVERLAGQLLVWLEINVERESRSGSFWDSPPARATRGPLWFGTVGLTARWGSPGSVTSTLPDVERETSPLRSCCRVELRYQCAAMAIWATSKYRLRCRHAGVPDFSARAE